MVIRRGASKSDTDTTTDSQTDNWVQFQCEAIDLLFLTRK